MKGLLFKPEMIKATIEGRKTVTRRMIKPEPFNRRGIQRFCPYRDQNRVDINLDINADLAIPYARYRIGEVVYIKEAWFQFRDTVRTIYKLDGATAPYWKSPMFLPEQLARYFLKIVSVRAERLQEITEEDAVREGVKLIATQYAKINYETMTVGKYQPETYRHAYSGLWDSINDKTPWESNPWVWRIEFELTEKQGVNHD